jgi:co-chaperonin GroES (HSP10)
MNKVLIEVFELGNTTKSGLYIPEMAKTSHQGIKGTVIAVGSTCKLGMKPGDIVLFEPHIGSRISFKVGDNDTPKDHLIVVEDAILGILVEVTNG